MDLELSTPVAAVVMLVLIAVVAGGTLTSPMSPSTKLMVTPGIVVFGVIAFLVGVLHGQYRGKQA